MSGSVDTAYNSTQETCIAKVLQLLIQSLLFEEVIFELRSELGEVDVSNTEVDLYLIPQVGFLEKLPLR